MSLLNSPNPQDLPDSQMYAPRRATQEVAGIGPGSGLLKYIKSEIKAAKALYLGGDCVLALEAEAGFIHPWGSG